MIAFNRTFCALAALALGSLSARAELTVAAAANLVYALDALKAAYSSEHPGISVQSVTSASGTLFAQIKAGAPYDVFLSADVEYPRALINAKLADPSSFLIFARGRLAFWSPKFLPANTDLTTLLGNPALAKIALANPQTAPYGRAAKQALIHLGQWQPESARWVYGENISQTAQFVESGNAQGGFVALSLLRSPKSQREGQYLEIPDAWHEPLDHAGVLTTHGAQNEQARSFLAFLRSPAARKVWEQFGYSVPNDASE